MTPDEFQHLSNIRDRHKQRLFALEEHAAITGINTPPEVKIEIKDIRDTIALIDSQLKNKGHQQNGKGNGSVSFWWVILIVVIAIIVSVWTGYEIGKRAIGSNVITAKLLQRLEFKYQDSPIEHGWVLVETTPITFTHLLDNFQGIKIDSNGYNGIETAVSLDAQKGNYIEFVIKPEGDAPVYAHVDVRSKEDPSVVKDIWLKFYNEGETRKALDNEYRINTTAISLSNGWQKFQVNLEEIVEQTIGKEGWEFSNLKGFRIRGNISLAYIEVYSK